MRGVNAQDYLDLKRKRDFTCRKADVLEIVKLRKMQAEQNEPCRRERSGTFWTCQAARLQ